jgi:cytidylate kinase
VTDGSEPGLRERVPVLALDGPSGSGKGTVATILANRLEWHLLDSGALYRLLALAAERHQATQDSPDAVCVLARALEVRFVPGDPVRVLWAGQDVTLQLRSEACGRTASRIAAIPEVRVALLQAQRAMRRPPGLVADGRDMGTVVFPDAAIKIYLTASVEERARRRYKQLKDLGMDANLDTILQDMVERDARDARRTVAPLKPAPDARILDTTGIPAAIVVGRIQEWAREVLGQTG